MAIAADPPAPAPSAPASTAAAGVLQQLANGFPRLGMKVRHLLHVIYSRFGGRRALAGLTKDQGNDLVFVPLTAATKLSLCEQLQAEGDNGVCIATWFVSHAWLYTFVDILEAQRRLPLRGRPARGAAQMTWRTKRMHSTRSLGA